MADQDRKLPPTKRRLDKAREKGQVARSRELPASLALLGVMLFTRSQAIAWPGQWRALWRQLLAAATSDDLASMNPLVSIGAQTVLKWVGPALVLGWVASLAGNLVQGGFVFRTEPLTQGFSRLNPATNLGRLFSLGALSHVLKSLVPASVIAYLAIGVFVRDWGQILHAEQISIKISAAWVFERVFEILWKAGLVFLVWSLVDYVLTRLNFRRSLRMSNQDIREEYKETEGNPQVKGKIRRLQRQRHRRFLMQDIARATVVVTNPTHYAVALEYRPESMEAPVVIAKGRNLIARRIREEAVWHGIPIVENPPLAQALYRAVDIGQAIPPKLYAAVAEILAFIFRAQAQARAMLTTAKQDGTGVNR